MKTLKESLFTQHITSIGDIMLYSFTPVRRAVETPWVYACINNRNELKKFFKETVLNVAYTGQEQDLYKRLKENEFLLITPSIDNRIYIKNISKFSVEHEMNHPSQNRVYDIKILDEKINISDINADYWKQHNWKI